MMALFIGGCADGERREVRGLQEWFRVPHRTKVSRVVRIQRASGAHTVRFKADDYTRRKLYISETEAIEFFALEGMSDQDAIRRLFSGYAAPTCAANRDPGAPEERASKLAPALCPSCNQAMHNGPCARGCACVDRCAVLPGETDLDRCPMRQ
jgi:hypothetical protein